MKTFLKLGVLLLSFFMLSSCAQGVTFTIDFDSNGGSPVDSISYEGNIAVELPDNPTKDGYIFDGWYWDNDTFANPFTVNSALDQPLQGGLTVYAKWNDANNTSTLLPNIELLGNPLVTLEVGTVFNDPGATVTNDFDLDIMTSSDLDMTTPGIYTLTYSIEYLDITYSVDRVVTVLDSVIFNLNISISDIAITNTAVSFTVSLGGSFNSLISPQVVLYQGTTIIRSYPLSNGDNVITIKTFSANTDYKIAIEGSYLFGGITQYLDGYEVSFTSPNVSAVAATPTIEVVSNTITYDSISFNVNIVDRDLVGQLTNIELYKGDTLINGSLELTIRNLTRLESGTEYTIKATYTYNLYDGLGEKTIETSKKISTLVKVVPILELNDEALMIVYKDSVFNNPGAVITNGFSNLTIANTSTVNTSVVGSYIMTYTVNYDNQSYGLLRYVLVADLTLTEATIDSLTYSVDFMDEYNDLDNEKLALYQGTTLIDSYALINGVNNITFSNLDDDTDYTVIIEGSYTDYEGTIAVKSMSESAQTVLDEPLMFTNTLEEIGVDYYSSTVNVVDTDEVLTSAVLTLYNDDDIASSLDLLDGDNSFYQCCLNLETAYTLKVDYTYIPVGTSEPVSETQILSSFETLPIPKPNLELTQIMVEYTYGFDYVYGIDITGFEDVGIYVVVKLNGDYVQTYQPSTPGFIEIDGLEEGTTYTIEFYVDYTHSATGDEYYDLLLDTMTKTTLGNKAYTAPTIENLVITRTLDTENSITVNFDVVDLDEAIFGDTRIRITNKYDSTEEMFTIVVGTDVEVIFSGDYIDPNGMYTIKIDTDYHVDSDDENDLYNEFLFEESFAMIVDVEVTSLEFEQSMYYDGDQIIMILELDNGRFNTPTAQYIDDVDVEYVTINGDKYYQDDFFFPSGRQTVYLNMGVETSYTDYSYHMTDFAVTLADGSSYVIAYDQTLSFRLHQLGDVIPDDATVSVLDIYTDDQTRQISEDTAIKSYAVLNILLDNIHDLEIYSVTVYGETYLASQFNSSSTPKNISLTVELVHGLRGYSVSELIYVRDEVNVVAEQEYHRTSVVIYSYYAKDAISISTAAELNSIDPNASGKYYKLAANIDLDGIEFNPINGNGVFDGGGFTISNLTLTSTLADQSSTDYLGLFGNVYGLIYNVELSNVTITVNTNETKSLYIGGLIGKTSAYVIDSHVTGINSITITGMNKGFVGGLIGSTNNMVQDSSADVTITMDGNNLLTAGNEMYVGGLIGSIIDGNANMSSASGSITITNTNNVVYNVGGLIGRMYSSTNSSVDYVYSSYASVDISTTNYGEGAAGGLVGKISRGDDTNTIILNSYASGDVYSKRKYIGGLVGDGGYYIENSFATGSVSTDSGSTDKVRLPDFLNYIFLVNCYTYEGQTVDGQLKPLKYYPGRLNEASADVYDSEDFYIRVLHWNTALYDFSNLDIENGMLPTLR